MAFLLSLVGNKLLHEETNGVENKFRYIHTLLMQAGGGQIHD